MSMSMSVIVDRAKNTGTKEVIIQNLFSKTQKLFIHFWNKIKL